MYSHFNKQLTLRLLWIALIAWMTLGNVKAQDFLNDNITLTVNPVMPPYTGRLSDYFNTPGKIGGSILIKSQMDISSYQFYLHVSIVNLETEASVRTKRGFVPSNPRKVDLSVIPNTTLIQYADLQQAMSEQNLEYSGFTREQVAREGLPPGQYMICMELFVKTDWMNRFEQLRTQCSPPFTIMPSVAVEPPVLIQPIDGSEIKEEQARTMQFTWTMPPGAPAGTQYKLKIIEVNDPGMNYRDMLRSDSYPAFFETTVTGVPTYLYTIANPAFKKDKTYAFVVRAIDPLGRTNFKNNGYSEVNTFVVKKSFVIPDDLNFVNPKPQIDNVQLNFISPRYIKNAPDTLKANTNENLVLAWKWVSLDVPKTKLPPTVDESTIIKERKIAGYVLTVEEIDANNGSAIKTLLKKEFARESNFDKNEPKSSGIQTNENLKRDDSKELNADLKISNNIDFSTLEKYHIKDNLVLSKDEAQKAGFREKKTYRATINVVHENGTSGETYQSNTFLVSYDVGEGVNMRVKAVLNYEYEGFPAKYPLANTDVEVSVYARYTEQGLKEKNDNRGSRPYDPNPISSPLRFFMQTDSLGAIDEDIMIPKYMFEGKEIQYYTIEIPNSYYVDKDFVRLWKYVVEKSDETGMESTKQNQRLTDPLPQPNADEKRFYPKKTIKENTADFGTLTAKTNAYRLVVNVKKEYPKYNISENKNDPNRKITLGNQDGIAISATSYGVNKVEPVKGLPVVLYRKNKQRNIPAIEGDITNPYATQSEKSGSITIVAVGTTTLNAKGDSSTVTFEKLLSTDIETETYYIQAVRNASSWIEEQKRQGISIHVERGVSERIKTTGTYSDALKDQIDNTNASFEEGFVSEPQAFRLRVSKERYYQTARADYNIISRKPPTSIIKGRLMYAWPSDKTKLRPLANAPFRVITDYVDGRSKSVGAVNIGLTPMPQFPKVVNSHANIKGYEQVRDAIYINGKDTIALADQWLTMAAGKTDANGYFEVEVVNLNEKGSLGEGTLYPVGWVAGDDPLGKGVQEHGGTKNNVLAGNIGGGAGPDAIINWGPGGMNIGPMNNVMNVQNAVNNTMSVQFNSATHSYDVGAGGKTSSKVLSAFNSGATGSYDMAETMQSSGGPNPLMYPNAEPSPAPQQASSASSPFSKRNYNELKRVFRMVIEGESKSNYFPSKDVVIIQPFEISETAQSITHYVAEMNVKVTVYEKNEGTETPINLNKGIQATIYRHLSAKEKNLPQGEGDGKYKFEPLIDPTYSGSTDDRQKFEHLWSGLDIKSDKEANPMERLLVSRGNYMIDVSSYLSSDAIASYKKTTYELWKAPSESSNWDRSVEDNTIEPVPVTRTIKIRLEKLPSRILVALKDSASQMPLTTQYAGRVHYGSSKKKDSAPIDAYGKVEITGNQFNGMGLTDSNSTTISFYGAANGYKDSEEKSVSLYATGSQHFSTIALLPAGRIKGRVATREIKEKTGVISSTEQRQGVASWLQFNKGKYYEVLDDGKFNLALPVIPDSKLEIKPKDVGYFDSIVVIKNAAKEVDLNDILVKRQRHRIQVTVVASSEAGAARILPNSTVTIDDMKRTADSNGNAYFTFENVSVNNYTLVVRGPEGANFIPKSVNISNEESKEYKRYVVNLTEGSQVSGTVKLDGAPVPNAKVYLDVVNSTTYADEGSLSNGDANLTYAYSDKNGRYTLRGIPVNNKKVNLHAVLDTTFTVEGDKRLVEIANGRGSADFTLKKFGDYAINKVFGFPLTVEKIEKVNADRVKVTGTINWTYGISKFKMKEVTKTVRIEDVPFKLTEVNGNKVGVPEQNEVTMSGITSLKLSLMDRYNVTLRSHRAYSSSYNQLTPPVPASLSIVKEKDRGKISGYMKIVDNSFRYPDDYLKFVSSEFHLSTLEGGKLNPVIDVVTSAFTEKEALSAIYNKTSDYVDAVKKAMALPQNAPYESSSPPGTTPTYEYNPVTGQMEIKIQIVPGDKKVDSNPKLTPPAPLYYLSDADQQPIKFKLIRFDAIANPPKSFINDWGQIQLDARIKARIPNAKPENLEVYIPGIMLDERKVYSASGSKPLEVKLEDWTLEVMDWKFSVEEGGINSRNARIHTKIIDIPVRQFVLREDMMVMDKFVMSDLSMGGGKFKLSIDTTRVKPALIYEQKIGRDMRPHWNFTLLSAGSSKAASLPKISYLDNYNVDIDYIEILSNNEMSVQLKQKTGRALLMGNNMAKFAPEVIMNGANDISLVGRMNVGAPRLGDFQVIATWLSPTSKPTFNPVTFDFETKGFVHFTAKECPLHIDKQNIAVLNGQISEQPQASFSPMTAHFFCRNGAEMPYAIKIKKGYEVQLSSRYNLVGTNGGMYVPTTGADWSLLRFDGWMTPKDRDNSADMKPSFTEFTVMGMIKAVTLEARVDGGLGTDMTKGGALSAQAKASYKLDVEVEKPDFVKNIEKEIGTVREDINELKTAAKDKYDKLTKHSFSTPLGEMTQEFDFPNGRLLGAITLNNVMLGGMTVHSGTIETCVDQSGFYIAGGCNAFIPLGIFSGNYNVGFMLGDYSLNDHLWNTTNKYIDERVRNTCYKQETTRLLGIYTAFNRELLNVSLPYYFPPAGYGYVKAFALLGGDMYFNVDANRWKLGMGAYAYLTAEAYLNMLAVASIEGDVLAKGKVNFELTNPFSKSYIRAHIGLGFKAKACILFPIKECLSTSVSASIRAGSDGFSFSLNEGPDKLGCGGSGK